jgi:uncharacterized protein (DUF1778 family)
LNEDKRNAILTLTKHSRKVFVEALFNPPKPNERALAAVKRFRREVR